VFHLDKCEFYVMGQWGRPQFCSCISPKYRKPAVFIFLGLFVPWV